MRMPPDHLARDRLDHVAEGERVLLFGHAGVKHHLQQEIAEFAAEIVEVAARDGLGDFIGFLDGVRRNRREILFEVPRAAGAGRAQRRHDLEQTFDIAGRGHGTPEPGDDQALVCRKMRVDPSETSQMTGIFHRLAEGWMSAMGTP